MRTKGGYHADMIGVEEIERYRAMTLEERLELFRRLMNFAWQSLLELPEVERRRRLEHAEREHALSSERLEAKFRSLS